MLKEGKKSEAVDCFQKSVDVSPEMALALIKVLGRSGSVWVCTCGHLSLGVPWGWCGVHCGTI